MKQCILGSTDWRIHSCGKHGFRHNPRVITKLRIENIACFCELVHRRSCGSRLRFRRNLAKRRQKNSDENHNDSDRDKEFDKREATAVRLRLDLVQ